VPPCASGGTLAGLIAGKRAQEQILAIAVLKGADFITGEVCRLHPAAATTPGWRIALDHHDGGYARFSPALWQWVQAFSAETGLPLEPIYSGKAMWGLFRELAAGRTARGSKIIFIHTGGLQAGGPAGAGRLVTPAWALVRQVEGLGVGKPGTLTGMHAQVSQHLPLVATLHPHSDDPGLGIGTAPTRLRTAIWLTWRRWISPHQAGVQLEEVDLELLDVLGAHHVLARMIDGQLHPSMRIARSGRLRAS
jgi:hypothetical protein